MSNNELLLYHGAVEDTPDDRDYFYELPLGASPITESEWNRGFDIEKELGFVMPKKNQFASLSCVGQAVSQYVAVKNTVETGVYDEVSAKAIYSQIFLPQGGAYFREGMSLIKDWGSLFEERLKSYRENGTTDETFMRDKSWKNAELDKVAKFLQAYDYKSITGYTIDIFAQAIRDNHGVLAGVTGTNNGTWYSETPLSPNPNTPQYDLWGHALYFGKFGKDSRGKWIASPNSWGLNTWQKFYEDEWFLKKNSLGGSWMFSPWTLQDKPNDNFMNTNVKVIKDKNSSAVGLWLPALSEQALKSLCLNFGINVPKNPDGGVDWDSWIQGELILK